MIKAIIFDVDGTLLDTETINREAWVQAGACYGYEIIDDVLQKTRDTSIDVAVQVFKEYCGEDFPYYVVRQKKELISEAIIASVGWNKVIKSGTLDVLNCLKKDNYQLAAASSIKYALTMTHLHRAGIASYFTTVIGGDMVTKAKPHPDIFLLAAEKLHVNPKDCLVVGDSPADVLAATAAEMNVILIPDCVLVNQNTKALSWKVLEDIRKLPEALHFE